MEVRAWLDRHELELADSGAPSASGPVLAPTWIPLQSRLDAAPILATIVVDERLRRWPVRFVFSEAGSEQHVDTTPTRAGEYVVSLATSSGARVVHRFTALDVMAWPGYRGARSADPDAAHRVVGVFLDRVFAGDATNATRDCSTVFDTERLERDLRKCARWRAGHAEADRRIEGAVDARFPRVVVSTSHFGPRGIQAFVLVAPVRDGFAILASSLSSFVVQPADPGPPPPQM